MRETAPRIPFGTSERYVSGLVEKAFKTHVHSERRPAARIFIAAMILLAAIPFFPPLVIGSSLTFGALMFLIGTLVSGPGIGLAGGVRWARIWLQSAGLGRLIVAGVGSAYLVLTGGDAHALIVTWGYGGISNLCFAAALYCIPLGAPEAVRQPERERVPENPRSEIERLRQETAANQARLDQLERDNPDFNRP